MTMFQPGEWAVLRHDQGGRLFQVDEVGEPDKEGRYRVWERSQLESQRSYRFDVWDGQLIKVESKDVALQLVAVLEHIELEYQSKVRALEADRVNWFHRAVSRYEMWQPSCN